jgi:hypothetical protein
MTAPAGLMEDYVDLEDPRSRRSPHGLLEFWLMATGASIGGANSWCLRTFWGGSGQSGLV